MNNGTLTTSFGTGRTSWISLTGALFLTIIVVSFVNTQPNTKTEVKNKHLIRQAFDRWADGQANFFDLLTDDVQWTIPGSSAYSKTYTSKQQFIDEAVSPLSSRLITPIVPVVRNLYADGDVVVAIWDGAATAKDNQPYRNTYSWAMTIRNGRITEVIAFLDLIPYVAVIERIPNPH